MTDTYIIGSGIPPDWVKDKLLPYRKMDGSIGYEFHGVYAIFNLMVGDRLILRDGKIKVKQRRSEDDR